MDSTFLITGSYSLLNVFIFLHLSVVDHRLCQPEQSLKPLRQDIPNQVE